MICDNCKKDIELGTEIKLFNGSRIVLCPRCYGRGQVDTSVHEITMWSDKNGKSKVHR